MEFLMETQSTFLVVKSNVASNSANWHLSYCNKRNSIALFNKYFYDNGYVLFLKFFAKP